MTIRFNDRVLVLGSTGSGKSEVINHLHGQFAGGPQRVLIDTKPEFTQEPWGVPITESVDAIDWDKPDVHLWMPAPEREEVGELFARLGQRSRVQVTVHELSDLCEFSAGKTPRTVNDYLSKGRVFGRGLIGGSQRPVNIPSRILTDADHVFVMASGFIKRADQDSMADALGLDRKVAVSTLWAAQEQLGYYAFMHFDRRERSHTLHPPLSEAERGAIRVDRPELF